MIFGDSEIESNGGFIETKSFDREGGRVVSLKPSVSTEEEAKGLLFSLWPPPQSKPLVQLNPQGLLPSRIPLVSMKFTFSFRYLIPPKIVKSTDLQLSFIPVGTLRRQSPRVVQLFLLMFCLG